MDKLLTVDLLVHNNNIIIMYVLFAPGRKCLVHADAEG